MVATELILNNETLKPGAKGEKVKQLQEILKALNLYLGAIDGNFGDKTLASVKQFQQEQGFNPDGVVGQNTQNALNKALQKLTTNPKESDISPKLQSAKLYGGVTGKLPLPAIPLIQEFEGCYLKAYPDPLTGGKPITIGWGSTKKRDGTDWQLGESITKAEADDLLLVQLEKNYLPTLQKIPVWNDLNANQQGALLSFGYNLGANFYGNPNFSSITKVLQNKQWDKIEETFVKYRNPGSNVEEGLKRRRLAEAKLFITPVS